MKKRWIRETAITCVSGAVMELILGGHVLGEQTVKSDLALDVATKVNNQRQIVGGSAMVAYLEIVSVAGMRLPTNYHELVQISVVDADGKVVARPSKSRKHQMSMYTNIVDGMYVGTSFAAQFRFDYINNTENRVTNDYVVVWELAGITSGEKRVQVVRAADSNELWRVKLAEARVRMDFDSDYSSALEIAQQAKAVVGPLFRTGMGTLDEDEAHCLYRLGRWQEALNVYKSIYENMKKDPDGNYGPLVPGRIRELEEKLNITPRTPVYQ